MSAFVDTNVLVYAADEVKPVPRKTRIARELLLKRGLHLSVQVLNEFTINARSANKLNLSREGEEEWVGHWLLFPVHPLTVDVLNGARRLHGRHAMSHWDALVLSTALRAGCTRLYTEDLQHGQRFGDLEVVNPFL